MVQNHTREGLLEGGVPRVPSDRVQQHDPVAGGDHTRHGLAQDRPGRLGARRRRQDAARLRQLDRGRRRARRRVERLHGASVARRRRPGELRTLARIPTQRLGILVSSRFHDLFVLQIMFLCVAQMTSSGIKLLECARAHIDAQLRAHTARRAAHARQDNRHRRDQLHLSQFEHQVNIVSAFFSYFDLLTIQLK